MLSFSNSHQALIDDIILYYSQQLRLSRTVGSDSHLSCSSAATTSYLLLYKSPASLEDKRVFKYKAEIWNPDITYVLLSITPRHVNDRPLSFWRQNTPSLNGYHKALWVSTRFSKICVQIHLAILKYKWTCLTSEPKLQGIRCQKIIDFTGLGGPLIWLSRKQLPIILSCWWGTHLHSGFGKLTILPKYYAFQITSQ